MITLTTVLSVCLVCVYAKDFQFQNKGPNVIWVGSLGNANYPAPNNGGWAMNPGEEVTVTTSDDWRGRFWARTFCNSTSQHCETGDCGNKLECNGAGGEPPATWVEITLQGDGGKDFYDVSLVDGYNNQATIAPIGGTGDGSQYSCTQAACSTNINNDCPSELQVTSNGVIACKSACLAFNTDQYCCRGAYGTKETCKPEEWPTNYAKIFKDRCPGAYSYAYDDATSTFTCAGTQGYIITFS